MLQIIVIITSLGLSFVAGYLFSSRKDKSIKNEQCGDMDDTEVCIDDYRDSSRGKNSKTAMQIKLKNDFGTCNAYFSNKNVFIAFNFKHMDDPHLLITIKDGIMADFEDGDYFFMGIYQNHFASLLNRGEVVIFSKTEGKLIDMIYREDMENASDYRTVKPQMYDYYLPDGVAFFTSARPFMSDPIF